MLMQNGLEHKFARFGDTLDVIEGSKIEGYASLFGATDQGGDVVSKGAYQTSLAKAAKDGRKIKMLWQHDPAQPIGVWDEVREDGQGLWVKGRILEATQKGREASALIEAGAIDGLSIGYRTVKSTKNDQGLRVLTELELWEVSLVTFPMLPTARVAAKAESSAEDQVLRNLASAFRGARAVLAPKD
ncbi:MAG: HK97 family phage prohead protease [Paracoccaceae bacterium]